MQVSKYLAGDLPPAPRREGSAVAEILPVAKDRYVQPLLYNSGFMQLKCMLSPLQAPTTSPSQGKRGLGLLRSVF